MLEMSILLKQSRHFILGKCGCDCGEDIPIRNTHGGLQRFKKAWHSRIGDKHTTETKQKLSENSGQWKGDDVGYNALHGWVRLHFPKPESCQMCHKITTKLDLANVSNRYLRKLSDWEYICRSCHIVSEGRNIINPATSIMNLRGLANEILS